MDEDYWSVIQNSFTVTRGIVNLNNGGVSPSPRIVTEALVRYIWQQEDATAYTMWQLLEPQSETIRTGLAEMFDCDREEIAITRNASESLEILLMGMDFKHGDEILTTTQDYPRMLTTLRQRERREGLVLKTSLLSAWRTNVGRPTSVRRIAMRGSILSLSPSLPVVLEEDGQRPPRRCRCAGLQPDPLRRHAGSCATWHTRLSSSRSARRRASSCRRSPSGRSPSRAA